MDQTAETEHKVRRLGRPPKAAKIVTIDAPIELNGAATVLDHSDTMNALAARIWEGQSVSMDDGWRVWRVLEGLKHHGYTDFSGLVLPVDNIGKYL